VCVCVCVSMTSVPMLSTKSNRGLLSAVHKPCVNDLAELYCNSGTSTCTHTHTHGPLTGYFKNII